MEERLSLEASNEALVIEDENFSSIHSELRVDTDEIHNFGNVNPTWSDFVENIRQEQDDDDEEDEEDGELEDDERRTRALEGRHAGAIHIPVPSGIIRPTLPDMRFEQAYLASITPAKGSKMGIFLITVRDQVVMPFAQGFLWAFAVISFKTWNAHSSRNGIYFGSESDLYCNSDS